PAGIAGTGVDAWLLPAPQTGPDDGQRWLRSLLQIKAARRTRLLLRQLQHRVRLRPPRALAVLTTHSARPIQGGALKRNREVTLWRPSSTPGSGSIAGTSGSGWKARSSPAKATGRA